MTDREVRVRLTVAGTQQFQQSMQQAAQSSLALQQSLGSVGASSHSAQQGLGGTAVAAAGLSTGLGQTTTASAAAGAGMAGFVKKAAGIVGVAAAVKSTVEVYGNFEQSLNRLQQVGGASAKTMEQVRVKAREVGKAVAGMSSTDAADAMLELAKGGLSVEQSMQAVAGTVNLAAAAQVSAAEAAEIQSKALNTFSLGADQAGHVADVLANTANAASGDITDFAQAMQQAGTPAAALGLTVDDTATALGLFANNGILGSDAGTSLKTMLMRLNPTSAKAAAAMKTLGVNAFDSQGEFVGLETVSQQLQAAQAKMTDQQYAAAAATAFGSDAVRGATVLAKEGAAGWEEMAGAVSKAGGASAAAEANTKGLKGSIDAIKAAVEDAQIAIGEKLAPVIETLLGLVKDVGVPLLGLFGDALGVVATVLNPVLDALGLAVGAFNSLPGPVKAGILALGGFLALRMMGFFSTLGTALLALPGKFKAMATSAKVAGLTMKTAFIGTGIGLAVAAIATAVSIFASSNAEAEARVREHDQAVSDLTATLNKATGAFTAESVQLLSSSLADSKADFEALDLTVGSAVKSIVAGAKDGGKSWQDYRDRIVDAIDVQGRLATVSNQASAVVHNIANVTGKSAEEVATAMLRGGEAVAQLEDDYIAAGGTAVRFGEKVNTVRGEFEETNPALREYREQVDAARDSTAKQNKEMDSLRSTAAEFAGVTEGQVASAMESAAKSGGSLEEALDKVGIKGEAQQQVLEKLGPVLVTAGDGTHYLTQKASESAAAQEEETAALEDSAEKTDWKAEADKRAAEAQERHNAAVEKAEDALQAAKDKLTPMAAAAQAAADAQNDLADQTDRVKDAMDRLSGRVPTVEEAMSDAAQATDDMAEQFKRGEDGAATLSDSLINASGRIKTVDQSGRDLRDTTLEVREKMIALGTATYDSAVASGDLAGAQDKAEAAMVRSRKEFVANAKAAGLTEQKANDVADAYGLIPHDVAVKVSADTAQAEQKQKDVAAKQKALDKSKATVQVLANTILALQKINEVNNKKISDKYFTIYEQHSVSSSGQRQFRTGAGTGFEADGHIVQAADGLVRDARIARGGSNILWAEPETGWEAYIPGHPSKRDRSEALMSEVAQRFGGLYVKDAQQMANGGLPGAGALAGRTARSPGTREGNILGALGDITAWVQDLRGVLADAAGDLADTKKNYAEARRDRDKEAAEQRRNVTEARREFNKTRAEQARAVSQAEDERRRALAAAQKELDAAKGFSERAEALREYDKANRSSLADLRKARADQSKENRAAAAAVRQATAEQRKANNQSARKVAAAKAEYQADLRATKAAQARTREAEDDLRRTRRSRQMLIDLGRQIDRYNGRLETQRDRLANLRDARAESRSSLRGTIAGFDSGILGHSDQRRTAGDIIRGLQFNKGQVTEFTKDLNRARMAGLSPALLEQIASAGVSGGAVTANALSEASRGQIARINSLSKQIINQADAGAVRVANAQYLKGITNQTAAVHRLAAKIDRLGNLDDRIASAVRREFHGLGNQELFRLVRKGERELGRR